MKLTPVSKNQHTGKRWLRYENYHFAVSDSFAAVTLAEVAGLASMAPIAFIQQQGQYTLVAVQSLTRGRNWFVAPDGRWLGTYVPAIYRGYPFKLLQNPEKQDLILCVDDDSGLVVEANTSGEEFFDADGSISPALKQVFDFLLAVERSRRATQSAVETLVSSGVVRPWHITRKTDHGNEAVEGLFSVDEQTLHALTDEEFLKLRQGGALTLAVAQLLSTSHLGVFDRLETIHKQLTPQVQAAKPQLTMPETLDTLFGVSSEETVRFK